MYKLKASPQTISYFVVSLSILPRLLSESVYQTGTVLILVFWIAPFVIISDLANEEWNIKTKLIQFPKVTVFIIIPCLILVGISFYWRQIIYADTINSFVNFKRSLYLINPLILFSWQPFIKPRQKKRAYIMYLTLSLGLIICLTIPKLSKFFNLDNFLNDSTALISSYILNFTTESSVHVNNNKITINNDTIEVLAGCSSIPQIVISLFSLLVFYICCKIKSLKYLIIIVIASLIIAYVYNAIRISLLGYLVSIDKMAIFHFWHNGGGSLVFSFIVMLSTCTLYYYLWSKENPIN